MSTPASLERLLPELDERCSRRREEAAIPGMAWGLVCGRELVHAAGSGTSREGEDRVPHADSVFRIASMTKSFTAATVLLLRDEGRLRLDDPVADHVPALAAWRPATTDSPAVTIRHLLTMTAGLPTDDPWGDRQQSLPMDRFTELLAAGPTFIWPTGTQFDYSNLGYGILGRVITSVAGAEYREVVRDRILRPLGMTASVFEPDEVPEQDVTHGYVPRDGELVREGTDAYGALASMGGLWSTVRDLATWVAGFLDAAPARDGEEDDHPLRRATRREMQQVQVPIELEVGRHAPDVATPVRVAGYGFGLFVVRSPELGTIVNHSGGYPGFGSVMGWHPASGLGIVGAGNRRYAPVRPMLIEALEWLVRSEAVPSRRVQPSSSTADLRPIVESLLGDWDDAVADASFAMNMDLDELRPARRAAIAAIGEALGRLRPDDDRPATSSSPADLTWWLRGDRGWARVSILTTPEPSPRLQKLDVVAVHDPSPELRTLADRVLALASEAAPDWPADLAASSTQDTAAVARTLRAAGARFGTMTLGLPILGDGRTTATYELVTERGGRATLEVGLDPGSGEVTVLALLAAARESPTETW